MDSPGPNDLPSRAYTLVLVSHSHSPPLVPAPQLKFDLRKITNPPKHIRDAYDGRSKRLREHMLANDDFVALVETAQASIAEEMMSFVDRDNDISESPEDQSLQFTVACFCEQGRHRSVALVEELARKKWPDEWDIETLHRDVENHGSKRKSQRHSGHKDSRKNNQKFVGLGEDS